MHCDGEVDRLRHEINCGRTGDKVAYPDPAAAPLGTDEEAAGTPLASDLVRQVRLFETSRNPQAGRMAAPFPLAWLSIVILVAVILIAALAAAQRS